MLEVSRIFPRPWSGNDPMAEVVRKVHCKDAGFKGAKGRLDKARDLTRAVPRNSPNDRVSDLGERTSPAEAA